MSTDPSARLPTLTVEISELRAYLLGAWRADISVSMLVAHLADRHGLMWETWNGMRQVSVSVVTSPKKTIVLFLRDTRPVRAWMAVACPKVNAMLFHGASDEQVMRQMKVTAFKNPGRHWSSPMIGDADRKEKSAYSRTIILSERSRTKKHDWKTVK